MRRLVSGSALLTLLLAAAVHAGTPSSAPRAPAAVTPTSAAKLKTVTLHIFSRVFEGFHDQVDASLNKDFRVGDTEYTGRVIAFVPDFTMNLKTHKVVTRSGEPKNPAFRIVVFKNGAPHDTSWAFFNMPPHFGAKDVLAFVATGITFTNRPALVSNDSLAIKIRGHEGGAH